MKPNGMQLVMVKDGKKITLTEGISESITIPDKSSEGWKDYMKNVKYWTDDLTVNQYESVMEYYYHRGNKYFFRNEGSKLMMEADIPDKMKSELKYHRKYDMTFSFDNAPQK